jgi:ABC-2 type transport system permease protein
MSPAALFAVVRKELRQAFRDKRMAFLLIVTPVIQLTLLGFAVDLDVDRVEAVVIDRDASPESRRLTRGLFADRTLEIVAEGGAPGAALMRGDAKIELVIPAGFAKDLAAGRSAQVQVLVDGTDPVVAQVAATASELYLRSRGAAELRARAEAHGIQARGGGIEARPRIFYNPRLQSSLYMVPGVAAVVLLIVTTVVTAMGIARERELGTIEQLLVTPISPRALLLGKTIPFASIGLVVAGLVLATGTHLFDVPIRGSLAALLAGTLAYLTCTLGVGIFVSTIARTQQQAMLGGFFFLMPAMLLSGFMSPIDNMPPVIRALTWLNPVRHYVALLRAVLLKGATLDDLLVPLGMLLAFGTAILTLASLRFRKRLA